MPSRLPSRIRALAVALAAIALAAAALAAAAPAPARGSGSAAAATAAPVAALPFTGLDLVFAGLGTTLAILFGVLVLLISRRTGRVPARRRGEEAPAHRAGTPAAGSR